MTYINTDADVRNANPTYVMAIHDSDGYMKDSSGLSTVDFANRSGTDAKVWRMSTVVIAQTDANGQGTSILGVTSAPSSCAMETSQPTTARVRDDVRWQRVHLHQHRSESGLRINWMVSDGCLKDGRVCQRGLCEVRVGF